MELSDNKLKSIGGGTITAFRFDTNLVGLVIEKDGKKKILGIALEVKRRLFFWRRIIPHFKLEEYW